MSPSMTMSTTSRVRKPHPAFRVDVGVTDNQRNVFEDLDQWYGVLLRPPTTWGVHEAATWAWMPDEHGGAGMPWLGQAMHDACVDGHLLLQLQADQVHHALLRGRPKDDVARVMRAIDELRHLAAGIASGQVIVPVAQNGAPTPPPASVTQLLRLGQVPPRRVKPLPWDPERRIQQQPGVQAAPVDGTNQTCQERTGRRVSLSHKEKLLAAATSKQRVAPPAPPRNAEVAGPQRGKDASPQAVRDTTETRSLAEPGASLRAGLKATYDELARRHKLAYHAHRGRRSRSVEPVRPSTLSNSPDVGPLGPESTACQTARKQHRPRSAPTRCSITLQPKPGPVGARQASPCPAQHASRRLGPYREQDLMHAMLTSHLTATQEHRIQRMRAALGAGQHARVQHTLKSQLSEDVARVAAGRPPRAEGFLESGAVQGHMARADREVALRLAAGVPVSRALYVTALGSGPRKRDIVYQVATGRETQARGSTPGPRPAPAQATENVVLPSCSQAASSTAVSPARVHRTAAPPRAVRSRFGPHRLQPGSSVPAHAGLVDLARLGRRTQRKRTAAASPSSRPAWNALETSHATARQPSKVMGHLGGETPATGELRSVQDILAATEAHGWERVLAEPGVMEAATRMRGSDGGTLLHHLASRIHRHSQGSRKGKAALTALLRAGADPNARDNSGRTPLHLLLDDLVAGACLKAADRINHFKAATNCRDVDGGPAWAVHLLLRWGAHPDIPDHAGITPVAQAEAAGFPAVLQLLKSVLTGSKQLT